MDTVAVERVAAPPAKSRFKFTRKTIALAGLALALAVGGVGYGRHWWTIGRFIESTDDAYVGGNVTPVSPQVAGFVAQILVADNQYVRASQLLIRLDPRDFAAALDHARAVLSEQRAALAGLERNTYCSRRWSRTQRPISMPRSPGRPLPSKTRCATTTWH